MEGATRRDFLTVTAATSTLLPMSTAATISAGPESVASVERDLAAYIGFGCKQSGGEGDDGCGRWLESELHRHGFTVEKPAISVPFFQAAQCEIVLGDQRAALWPLPIVVQTPGEGVLGRLVRVDGSGRARATLDGAIALVDLPYGRWSSALAEPVRKPVNLAFAQGAKAVVVITNGPTGKVIALNADGQRPMFAGPVGLLAPEDAGPFLEGSLDLEYAAVVLRGEGGRRPAFNVIGRLNRGKGRWIVVSTPRSGWFTCAAERGGGIAAWLALARWAPGALPDHDIAFLCNSGHEYENLGAEASLKTVAPKPEQTSFWLHLGANLAARDWHEGLFGLMPLHGADSQRYLVTSSPLLTTARRIFEGLPGLESPYSSDRLSAGELTAILSAGYARVAGLFGLHRYHHVAEDNTLCTVPAATLTVIEAFRNLLAEAAKRG